MGIYWWSVAYVGRLLSRDALQRLEAALGEPPPGEWLTDLHDPRGRYVLHAPGGFVHMGGMDPALEEHEVRAGVVRRADLERALGPGTARPLFHVPPDVAARLAGYVQAAAPVGGGEAAVPAPAPGVYVMQAETSTLCASKEVHVTHNIRVL